MLDRLPVELLRLIFDSCDEKDAIQTRLVNKTLAETCAPLVFQAVDLCFFAFSLSKLRAIAQSRYNKLVKTLRVYVKLFPDLNRTIFRKRVKYNTSDGDETRDLLDEDWRVTWQTYRNYLTEQSDLFSDSAARDEFWKHLRDALIDLPALNEITAKPFDRPDPVPSITQVVPWRKSPLTMNSVSLMRSLCWCSYGGYHEPGVRLILVAMARRAALESSSPIRRLIIDTSYKLAFESMVPWDIGCGITDNPDEYRTFMLGSLQHLEALSLHLGSDVWAEDAVVRNRNPEVRTFLASCTRLRYLKICYAEDIIDSPKNNPSLRKYAPLSSLFGATSPPSWPQLQILDVSTKVCNGDMLSFLETHGQTLTSLKMTHMVFDDAEAILNHIPTSLRKLRHVSLAKLYSWSVCNYNSWADDWKYYFPRGMRRWPRVKEWLTSGGDQEAHGRLERPIWRAQTYDEAIDEEGPNPADTEDEGFEGNGWEDEREEEDPSLDW